MSYRHQSCNPVYEKLLPLFHDATLADIIFKKWRGNISLVIICNEYLGNDFPLCGVFEISFSNTTQFSMYCTRNEEKSSVDDRKSAIFSLYNIEKCITERNTEGRKSYRLIVTGDIAKIEVVSENMNIVFLGSNSLANKIMERQWYFNGHFKDLL